MAPPRAPLVALFLALAAAVGRYPATGDEGPPPPPPSSPPQAPPAPVPPLPLADERLEASIPMRDGSALAATVWKPKGDGRWPVVLVQTPYGRDRMAPRAVMDGGGYAYVVVDTRGRGDSKAAPAKPGYGQRRDDGYDAVEWAAAQPWCDGKVGTWGASALGQQQFRTAEARPPHLVCCVPLVSGLGWRYPTFHPGGVLREEYVAVLDRLGFGTGGLIRGHPLDDAAWRLVDRAAAPDRIDVPVLMIGGWFDLHPDEMVDDFRTLCASGGAAARGEHRLLVGPWTHHVSASYANDPGELPYRETASVLRVAVRRWFDRWLRGVATPPTPRVTWFALGADVWRSGETWPPVAANDRAAAARFFLAGDHRLLRAPGPADAPPIDATYAIVHDPAHPVKTLGGANLDPSLPSGPHDQRAGVLDRPDVVFLASEPLAQALRVEGRVAATLDVTVDPLGGVPARAALDADVHVRLCDVFPDGRVMLLADAARRVSLRTTFSRAEPVEAGRQVTVGVVLPDLAFDLLPGHRLGLAISASNAPRYEVSPVPVRLTLHGGSTIDLPSGP